MTTCRIGTRMTPPTPGHFGNYPPDPMLRANRSVCQRQIRQSSPRSLERWLECRPRLHHLEARRGAEDCWVGMPAAHNLEAYW